MTHNAIIYLRVSTEEQAIGYSLNTQVGACSAYAIRQGYTIVHEIEEHYSGHELQRPGLTELYAFIATHDVQCVIVYDPDRLSRGGPAHHAIIETRLATYGVKIAFAVIEQDSTDVFIDEFAKQNFGWYESKQRSRRVLNGKLNKVKAGNVMLGARSPFGYDYIGGELVVNGAEAAVVRKIYQLYLGGDSTYQIAKRLSAESVPTKADKPNAIAKRNDYGVWNPSTVKKILNNETYTGYWQYNKSKTININGKKRQEKRPRSEWVAVAIPALIEPTTFQQVQQQLATNRAQQKYPANRFYLLQGMLYCACGLCCGCDYRREFLFYRCPIKARQTWQRACVIRFSVEAAKIEGVVWDVIAKLLANPEKLKTAIKKQRQRQAAVLAEMDCQLDAIRVAKLDTERRLNLLLDSILDGYPHEILQERKQLLLDKRKHLEIEEAKVNSALPSVTIMPEQEKILLALSALTLDELRNLNFIQKCDTLQLLQVHVAVVDHQRIKVSGILNCSDAEIDIA